MMLRLSRETEDKVQRFLDATTALVWTKVMWNICAMLGYGLLAWLIIGLFEQLQALI
jgi:hypothetical protein